MDKPMGVEAHCSKYCSMDVVFLAQVNDISCFRPVLHVLGVEDGALTDVTRRYTSNFLTEVLKQTTYDFYQNLIVTRCES